MKVGMDPGYAGEGIYREFILDHYSNPRNSAEMENPTVKWRELNPVCGDEITVFLKLQAGIIKDISFLGKGCAISKASMSMLTEQLKGKRASEAAELTSGGIMEMLGIELGPSRVKCAVLGMVAVKNAVAAAEDAD